MLRELNMKTTRKKKKTAPVLLPPKGLVKKTGKRKSVLSREPVQSIIYNTSSVIFTKDILGRFTYANERLAQLLNTTVDKLIGKTVFDFCPADYAEKYTKGDFEAMDTGKAIELREDAIIDGSLRHFISVKYPIYDEKGKIAGVGGISTDITRFVIQEREAQQKLLLETTLEAQEKERKEIGYELHDNVIQLLATSKILINAAMTSPENMAECLNKSKEFIMRGLKEIRHISHAMLPPPMDATSFLHAIEEIGELITMSGEMTAEITLPGAAEISILDDQFKLNIYRIIQEQVNNIIKHSRATKMSISLSLTAYTATLIITDNGVGANLNDKRDGIGLKSIVNRAQLHNSSVQINTAKGKGFELIVETQIR